MCRILGILILKQIVEELIEMGRISRSASRDWLKLMFSFAGTSVDSNSGFSLPKNIAFKMHQIAFRLRI